MKRILSAIVVTFLWVVAWGQCYEPNLQKADAAYACGEWRTAYEYYKNASSCPDAKRFENGKKAKAGIQKCQPVLTVDGEKDVVVQVASGAGNKSFHVRSLRLSSWRVTVNYRGDDLELTPDVSKGTLMATWNANTQPTPREFEIIVWGEGGVSDAKATIRIIQEKSELTINGQTTLEKTFSWEGGASRFDVSGLLAGQDYTVSGVDASWMSIQKKSNHFFLIVASNDSNVSERTKTIMVSGNHQTITLKITQQDCRNKEELKARARVSLGELKVGSNCIIPFATKGDANMDRNGVVINPLTDPPSIFDYDGSRGGYLNSDGEVHYIGKDMHFVRNVKNTYESDFELGDGNLGDKGCYPINDKCFIQVSVDSSFSKRTKHGAMIHHFYTARLFSIHCGESRMIREYKYNDTDSIETRKKMRIHRFINDDFVIDVDTAFYGSENTRNLNGRVLSHCVELWKANGILICKKHSTSKPLYFDEGFSICTKEKDELMNVIIKRNGAIVTLPAFIYDLDNITDDIVLYHDKTNKYGYYDLNGKILIKAQYYGASPFSEGYAFVCKSSPSLEEWFFIDKKGKTCFKGKYSRWGDDYAPLGRPFSEGQAALRQYITHRMSNTIFIDRNGEIVFELDFTEITGFSDVFRSRYLNFTVGDDYMFIDGLAVAGEKGRRFFINKEGHRIFDKYFEDVTPFTNGLAGIMEGRVWGIIDKQGKEIVPSSAFLRPSFNKDGTVTLIDRLLTVDSIGNQYDGLCVDNVKVEKGGASYKLFSVNGVVGYFNDTLGVVTVPPRFNEGLPFSEELAAVKIDSRWGFIDEKGVLVIPTVFEQAKSFSNGRAEVVIDGKTYYIDKKGTILEE